MKAVRRVLLILAVLPFVVLGITGAAAIWLLFTEPGGRWALEQVPGLEVEAFEGALGNRWQADHILYDDGAGTRASVDEPDMAWRTGCLLRMKVCLDRFHSGGITVSLPETDDEPAPETGPPELPEISLPFTFQVLDLDLGRVSVDDALVFERLAFAGSLSGDRLRIEALQLDREALSAGLSGRLWLSGDWPLEAGLDLDYRLSEDEYPGTLSLRSDLDGTVANLALDTRLSAPWQARLTGHVRPLQPGIPVELTLQADEFLATPDLDDTLRFNDVLIEANGNLDEGWQVVADGALNTAPALPVSIAGHVDMQGADIETLALNAGTHQYLRVRNGRVGWADGLSTSGSLEWRHFPWQRLIPDMEPLPVALEQAFLDFSLEGDAYEGVLDAALATPEGLVTLNTPLKGTFEDIELDRLLLTSTHGSAQGRSWISWADQLSWDSELELAGLKPGTWIEELPGELQGRVESKGRLTEQGPVANAVVALDGQLRQQNTALNATARIEGEHWDLEALDLVFGDNRLSGNARQQDTLDVALDLDMTALDQLWPGLAGQVEGAVSARDILGRPFGSGGLKARGLRYEAADLELAEASLDLDMADALSGTLGLEWRDLTVAGQRIEAGSVRLSGDERDHELTLALEHEMAELGLGAQGGWHGDHWQGQLTGGRVDAMDQLWLQETPAELRIDPQDSVKLGNHCWAWGDARLCAGDQQLYPQPQLDLALHEFPTTVFEPFLPPDMRWDETLSARVLAELTEQGPEGTLWVDGGAGQVGVRQMIDPDDLDVASDDGVDGDARWIALEYDTLRADVGLSPEEVDMQLLLAGPEIGRLAVRSRMDPTDETYPLDGSVELDRMDLALVRPFLDLNVVEGQIQGRATVSGPLESPQLQGNVRLEEGRILDPRLPIRLDHFTLEAAVDGEQATLGGQWRSGDEGTGEISGLVTWLDGLQADVSIDGERLPVTVEPFAELLVFPAIEIRYNAQGLRVGGRVDVPSGQIEVRSLPEGAVRVSEDQVIEGEEETADPLNLTMDLVVVVGEDRVSFEGFGVTGNLRGRLRLVDEMEARGELSLVDGIYRLYGQQLTIRRAQLIFSGPLDQPFLDIEAVREVGDVTAGVRLSGRADEPQAEIFAQPSMSEPQALSYIMFGRPMRSEGDSNVVGEVALALGLAQTAPVTRELGERVGIQDLQLETEGTGDEASVVATGYITDRLSLRYGVGLFQPVNRLAVRYDLTQRLFLEAASGVANSMDIFYQRDY